MNDKLHHVGLDVSSFGEDGKHHFHIPGKITFALLALSLVAVGCIILLDDADTSSAGDPDACGTNLKFTYTESDHTLTIYQPDKNAAASMGPFSTPPWVSNVSNIEKVVFDAPKLTNIADNAFREGTALSSITIPDSVTTIQEYAFYMCGALSSVTIGDSVTTIGNGAFRECTSLESIVLPDSLTTIGNGAFYGCAPVKSIVIPDSVTAIGEEAFYGCTQLESAIIGNAVTTIGDRAFYGCTQLESAIIGNAVTGIGQYAFFDCNNLTKVWIGNSLTTTEYQSFTIDFYVDGVMVTLPGEEVKIQGLYFLKTASGFQNNATDLTIAEERSHTYNGTVHSLVAESDKYSMENCSSKDAGNFHAKVTANPGYRLKWTDSEGTHEATVCEFDWSIAPIEIGLTWGETVFKYDGKSHVPVATATGLIGGDVCTVNVSGAQIDAGKYTATASSLSNSNYVLPTDTTKLTCEFTIESSSEPVSGEEPTSIGMPIAAAAVAIVVAMTLIFYLSGRKN